MAKTTANNIEIAYELHGDRQDPAIVLIQGLGLPMVAWPDALIDRLIKAKFCVLQFDNRDMGQSEQMDHLKIPNLGWQWLKSRIGLRVTSPYLLKDMMRDTEALMEALGIKRAHIVGASMGGMIAQLMAIHHPERILSLTSIMSTSGCSSLPKPTKEFSEHTMTKPESQAFEHRLAFHKKTWRLMGSPGYPSDEEYLDEYVTNLINRGIHPKGTLRQMLAILGAPSRVKALRKLNIPSLVIHGDGDPVLPVENGIHTASQIPNAKLEIIQGMGHDFPIPLMNKMSSLIIDHIRVDKLNTELNNSG